MPRMYPRVRQECIQE